MLSPVAPPSLFAVLLYECISGVGVVLCGGRTRSTSSMGPGTFAISALSWSAWSRAAAVQSLRQGWYPTSTTPPIPPVQQYPLQFPEQSLHIFGNTCHCVCCHFEMRVLRLTVKRGLIMASCPGLYDVVRIGGGANSPRTSCPYRLYSKERIPILKVVHTVNHYIYSSLAPFVASWLSSREKGRREGEGKRERQKERERRIWKHYVLVLLLAMVAVTQRFIDISNDTTTMRIFKTNFSK